MAYVHGREQAGAIESRDRRGVAPRRHRRSGRQDLDAAGVEIAGGDEGAAPRLLPGEFGAQRDRMLDAARSNTSHECR